MPRKKTQREQNFKLVEIKRKIGADLNGKSKYKSFYGPSKAAAEEKYRQYLVDSAKERPAELSNITFSEWAEKWLLTYKEGEVRAVTYHSTYEQPLVKHILPVFGSRRLSDILPVDIVEFYKGKSELSFSVLSNFKLIFNGIFESAIENKLITSNPAKRVRLPKSSTDRVKEKRAYTYEQARSVISFAKTHPYGDEVILLLKTGMRKAELLALKWSNVDLKNRIIYVKESVSEVNGRLYISPCKTKKSIRDIPFDDEAYSALCRLKERLSLKKVTAIDPYVISGRYGRVMSPNNWSARHFKSFMRDLSIADPNMPILTVHEMRHSFGSVLYSRGVDIVTISKLMGHASIDITVRLYVHDDFEVMRSAIERGI